MKDLKNWQDKFELCIYAQKLLDKVTSLNNIVKTLAVDIEEVKKAIYYARKYHGTQMRQSGEPYYSHPIEVAYMLVEYAEEHIPQYFRTDMLVIALLHDTIEDTELTKETIGELFGEKISNQVMDLTRVKEYGKITSAKMVEILYKEKKHDVLLIKLFDRLHNIQTIDAKSPEKIKKIIEESMKYFIVLGEYLNLPYVSYLIKKYTNVYSITKSELNTIHFSYQDNYQPLSPIYQSRLYHKYNLLLQV